jgi:uncharacterized protein YqgC (DUF456 family)
MEAPSAILLLVGAAMLVGLAGAFIPGFPDLLLIWGAALAYGLLGGWGPWGGWIFAGITVLALVGLAADIWVSSAAARLGGASFWGIAAGLVLGFLGLVFFTPVGGLLGLLLGTFLVEYLRRKDVDQAGRATAGMGLGYGLAFVVKFGIGALMVGAWIVWVVTG